MNNLNPTHKVYSPTVHVVDLSVPRQPPRLEDDKVIVRFFYGDDQTRVSMPTGDWDQFVACVIEANKEILKHRRVVTMIER